MVSRGTGGAFGGGIYANVLDIRDSVISGNSVTGAGAAGGGIYSVGGAESADYVSKVTRSSITGNAIMGIFTYGGGIYSDGGGIGNLKTLFLKNTTIAWNSVAPVALPPNLTTLYSMGYWRGGGVYMSNGYLDVHSCTIVENEVSGYRREDSLGKQNMAGGIAATVGNAHAVEEMRIGQSIIAGNTIKELASGGGDEVIYNHDIFTGSLLHFRSFGYNRFGVVDFSQILVPVWEKYWKSLVRKHFPKAGDEEGVDIGAVLGTAVYDTEIDSVGLHAGERVPLHFLPQGSATDVVPASWIITETYMELDYVLRENNTFLEILLDRIEDEYRLDPSFANEFTTAFETFLSEVDADPDTEGVQSYSDPSGEPILTLDDTYWFGPNATWPSSIHNYPYIQFWHQLDSALAGEGIQGVGAELLGDTQWSELFEAGDLEENENLTMRVFEEEYTIHLTHDDQLGNGRPVGPSGDIGAVDVNE